MFKSDHQMNAWNAHYANKVAGCENVRRGGQKHCVSIRINAQLYMAHRVVWEMFNGDIPEGMMIDHINGNPFDNRIENLRLATPAQNMHNGRIPKTNTTRLKGVYRSGNGWMARIRANGENIYVGQYPTKGLAAVARAKAALRFHGEFARYT